MGYKIRDKRKALNLTQEELSAKSGVSRATISGLENGKVRATSSKTLLKLAKALNTTVDQIFFEDDV